MISENEIYSYNINNYYYDKKYDPDTRKNIDELKTKITELEFDRAHIKSRLIPVSIIFIFIIMIVSEILYQNFVFFRKILSYLPSIFYSIIPPPILGTIFIGIPALLALVFYFYFAYNEKIRLKKNELKLKEQLFISKLMRDSDGRFRILSDRIDELTRYSSNTFFENKEKSKNAAKLIKEAGRELRCKPEKADLSKVQYIINVVEESIYREGIEKRNQRRWQIANLIIISTYIIFLAYLMIYVSVFNPKLETDTLPFIKIPIWVVVWGALGSISAILYRFYKENNRVKFSKEFRWLIARLIIGIIMSAVAYLAITSGLVGLGASSTSNEKILTDNAESVVAILCFLAGFSDRVYQGIINILVNQFPFDEEPDRNDSKSKTDAEISASEIDTSNNAKNPESVSETSDVKSLESVSETSDVKSLESVSDKDKLESEQHSKNVES